MSQSDGYTDEMGRFSDMSAREIERLLVGGAPQGDAEIDEVARFFKDFGEAYPETSMKSHETAHVAAMVEAAHLLAEKGEPVARPASKAHGPECQASGLPKWRRNVMVRGFMSSRLARVAAIAAVLTLAFGAAALAGALPAPVQDAVAGAAQQVGIDLPQTDDGDVDDAAVKDVDDVDDGDVDQKDDAQADQNDDAADEAADQAEDQADKAADQAEDQADETDDQAEDQADETDDQAEDQADEAEDQAEEAADQD